MSQLMSRNAYLVYLHLKQHYLNQIDFEPKCNCSSKLFCLFFFFFFSGHFFFQTRMGVGISKQLEKERGEAKDSAIPLPVLQAHKKDIPCPDQATKQELNREQHRASSSATWSGLHCPSRAGVRAHLPQESHTGWHCGGALVGAHRTNRCFWKDGFFLPDTVPQEFVSMRNQFECLPRKYDTAQLYTFQHGPSAVIF